MSKYSSNPSDAEFWKYSQSVNPSSDWELPHIMALVHGNTAGASSGAVQQSGDGTSFAAPQVAGIAAGILEGNPNLRTHPEALMAGILAGAHTNVDGPWPLKLSDTVDDTDGVGLVDALLSARALKVSARVSPQPGGCSCEYGHNYGTLKAGGSVTYRADVDPGHTLRIASVNFSKPSCGAIADENNCSSEKLARLRIRITSPGTGSAANYAQNYQYVAWTNNTGVRKSVPFVLEVVDMDGLSSSSYGIAWQTHD